MDHFEQYLASLSPAKPTMAVSLPEWAPARAPSSTMEDITPEESVRLTIERIRSAILSLLLQLEHVVLENHELREGGRNLCAVVAQDIMKHNTLHAKNAAEIAVLRSAKKQKL